MLLKILIILISLLEKISLQNAFSTIQENSKEAFDAFDLSIEGAFDRDLANKGITAPSYKRLFVMPVIDRELSVDSCAYNCSRESHIACGNSWSFSPQCQHNAKLINLDHIQSLILHKHNAFRNNLAGHKTRFEPAVRMRTMQWHPELAKYAQLNAMTCSFEHDHCHDTAEFKMAGQNLAFIKWSGFDKNLSSIITKMINNWYSEYQFIGQSDLDNYHNRFGLHKKVISHFTNIVNERNDRVGCGAVAEKDGKFNKIYFTCNYAHTNIVNLRIYEKGPTASKCLTDVNPEYENLCSIKEA